ncbi:PcfJ domain-containing protein [Marinobacter sp.]|uniref:PcfJ domain-containing protein n=1 Tax=Marinobacter sp. TaxID=50741 RepID=UPI0035C6DCF7
MHSNLLESDLLNSGNKKTLEFDFRPFLDCRISVTVSESDIELKSQSHGITENNVDPGFALFFDDGNSAFGISALQTFSKINEKTLIELLGIKYLQLVAIKTCLQSERAKQMFDSNRALFWIILEKINKDNCYSKAIVDGVFGVKRRLLTKLALDEDKERTVKFLEKIVILTGERSELDLIVKKAKEEGVVDKFKHWNSIPVQALYVDERFPDFSSAYFMIEWCQKPYSRMSDFTRGLYDIYRIFEDAVEMGNRLNIKNSRAMLVRCVSVEKLKVLHDHWVSLTIKSTTRFSPDIDFKEPNFEVPNWLEWIGSANQLIDEGKVMEHCIGTYVNKALSGRSLLFRVLLKERATLELRERDNNIEMVEVKKKNNERVDDDTNERIQKWIRETNRKLKK